MSNRPDPMEILGDAYRDAQSVLSGTLKRIKAESVTRPLDPNAKKLTDDEFLGEYQKFRGNPAEMQSREAGVRNRYNVQPGRVPRRLVEFALEGHRIERKRDKEQAAFLEAALDDFPDAE